MVFRNGAFRGRVEAERSISEKVVASLEYVCEADFSVAVPFISLYRQLQVSISLLADICNTFNYF